MFQELAGALSWASGPLAVGFEAGLRATALLALAFGAHAALGRSRAPARSALWNACLIGLLLIPASVLALPRLVVPSPLPATANPFEGATAQARPEAAAAAARRPVEAPPALSTSAVLDRRATSAASPGAAAGAPPGRRVGLDFGGLALVAYLTVAALLAARLAGSLSRVGALRRRCEPATDRAWTDALERRREALGIGRRVALLESAEVSTPVVVGWLRPAILLPRRLSPSGAAPPGLIDAVLVHELAHVRRGDFGWNLVRRLVQIVYWPHPLAWPLGRVVGAVREQACDDLCVHVLGTASAYRASLLEVASGLVRRPDAAVGLAMARTTNLAARLAWIDRSRGASRCLLPAPSRLALAAAVLAVAGAVGSIEPTRTKAAEQPGPSAPADSIEITVTAADAGEPLAGAAVRCSIDLVAREFRADRDGKVVVDLSRRLFKDSLGVDVWADGYVQQRFSFSQVDPRSPRTPDRLAVALRPGEETLGGTVTDEAGRPIAGVKVQVWGYLGEKKEPNELAYMVDATTDARGAWRARNFRGLKFAYLYLAHPDYLIDDDPPERRHGSPDPAATPMPGERTMAPLRDFSDAQVLRKGVAISGTVVDAEDRPIPNAEVRWRLTANEAFFLGEPPTTTTDGRGGFRFAHVRPGRLTLVVKASGHAPGLKRIEAAPEFQPVAIRLEAARTLAGRVVDPKGKPIPDVFVSVDAWRGLRSLGVFLKTDADGRFRWDDAPPDAVRLHVSRAGFQDVADRPVKPGPAEIVLELKRALSIVGSIRDADADEPIRESSVELGIPDPKNGGFAWAEDRKVFTHQGRLQAQIDADRAAEFRLRFSADGYERTESRTFRNDEGQIEYDVKLARAKPEDLQALSGVVLRPDGRPLEGADVTLTYPFDPNKRLPSAVIKDGALRPGKGQAVAETDAQGRFRVPASHDPRENLYSLIVVHPDGYAEVPRAAFEADSTIKARPWGRIEGTARIGRRPASGAAIRYGRERPTSSGPLAAWGGTATADDRGRFVAPFAVDGDARVSLQDDGAGRTGVLVEVKAGATVRADVGGTGRAVIARVVAPGGGPPDADHILNSTFSILNDLRPIPYPEGILKDHVKAEAWVRGWWDSPEGRAHRRDHWFSVMRLKLQPDGSIRVDDVPPGSYRLHLTYTADPISGLNPPGRAPVATKSFTIAATPDGRTDEPLDLGELRPAPKEAAEPAPAER